MTPQVTAQDAVGDKITLTSVSQTMVDAGQVATSDNALTAFRGSHLKVAGGVSHMGERTLGLYLSSLAAMTDPLADVVLASGLTPMCASFNACLDFACDTNADILFHTASDVVVDPRALTALLEVMDLSQNYLAVARGHDPMFGDDTSVGIWIWNMRIMKRDFRFNDVFKQDLDLCERVEAATGKTRVYTPMACAWAATTRYGRPKSFVPNSFTAIQSTTHGIKSTCVIFWTAVSPPIL